MTDSLFQRLQSVLNAAYGDIRRCKKRSRKEKEKKNVKKRKKRALNKKRKKRFFLHLWNAAARLITRRGRREHITPVLRELHWLPVRRRVDFKLATFMYKTLHGQIPRYLSGDCQLISDASRRLRSSDTFTFSVPRTRTRLGDRSFAVAGPQIWNSLPADLRLVDNYARFRRLLKGHMFGWGCGA